MSPIVKAALFMAAMSSVLGAAQTALTSPAQKPSPAVNASPAVTGQQRAPVSPYGHRFVPSENLPHPNQPVTPVQTVPRPATPQAVNTPAKPAVQPPVLPQAIQAAIPAPVAAQPAIHPPSVQPAAMSQLSPSAPAAVDYTRGQLTVVSERATLGQVLKLVAAKTGGMIDVAPELQNEPVIARLGPGSVREVLSGLLDSPKVDYIIMGAGDGPSGLERVVVRTRQAFGRSAMAVVHPTQPQAQPEQEAKADETGHLPNGLTPAEAKLTQEQLMENWKKTREQMRVAEIQQQAQDRENEKNQPQVEPQPEPPNGPPPPPDDPPQR